MKKSYFREEQHFSNPGFWAFLIFVLTISFSPLVIELYNQVVLKKVAGENATSTETILIILFVMIIIYVVIIIMFKKMRLITEVGDDAFYFRYPPFILKNKQIDKTRIERFEVRKYKPIREYGGWGIRMGSGKAGKAYNVKGKIGLQLYLTNGKKVLFGTQRGDAIKRAMNKLMQES